jgi:NAD(P)-dependent dehydrogenase (short-subunit alcohol dehydrogenase family)
MPPKTILITGATSGIGRVAAESLAQQGAQVVLVGRNPAKTEAAVDEIRRATGNVAVDYLLADLSKQTEVRRLAEEFKRRYARLDVLVNNAGGVFRQRTLTADGREMTFALNHLSYFLLTNLLLDTLVASAPARIVNVASRAHMSARGLNFDDLDSARGYFGFSAYARSKLANILFTYELARRLAGTRVTANAMHPGLISTGFGANNGPLWALLYVFINALGRSPAQGADTLIYLAASPAVEGVTGQYFYQRKARRSSAASHDAAAARRLWDVSARLVGLPEAVKETDNAAS